MIWNILCSGESILDAEPDPQYPSIGVNLGIRHPIQPEYYCCTEGPYKTRPPLHKPKEGWVRKRMQSDLWETSYELAGIRGKIPWKPRIKWPASSVFYAIAVAAKRGATEIRMYGADMKGEGYWDPATGEHLPVKKRSTLEHKRWPGERAAMENVVKECAEHGVKVVFL